MRNIISLTAADDTKISWSIIAMSGSEINGTSVGITGTGLID